MPSVPKEAEAVLMGKVRETSPSQLEVCPTASPEKKMKFLVSGTGHLRCKFSDCMLVLIRHCIFVHMTDKFFLVTGRLSETSVPHCSPQSGVARIASGKLWPSRSEKLHAYVICSVTGLNLIKICTRRTDS